ncbi:HAD family hydrolase [Catenulispora pinisilvae]|uniref:HAD family hydrolase n=1 Tax=Catenulispora pinisilvae TaxID=2705253 RepID=UPI001891A8A4|nr:HAD family hydrolase [Catenulispora pinisilvae]
MSPQVIATDLDRTLLRSDGTTSARTRAALDLAMARGAHVIAVTARPVRWLDRLKPCFGRLPHVIASNGAVCYDLAAGAAYDARPFDPATVAKLLADVRAALPGARFALETPHGMVREADYELSPFDQDDDDAGRRVVSYEELPGAVADDPLLKILAADRGRGSAAMFVEALPAVGTLGQLTYSTNRGVLELGPPGVTKASTLAAWCAARDIDVADVVTFGDMPNDVPMLRWAGRSYAVANALDEVKAAASGVTASNDEDGVAQIVEELFHQ